jgi:hypothetical protein
MAGLSGFAHPPGGMLAVLEDRGLRRTFQGRTESGGPLPPTSRPAIRSTVPGSATDTQTVPSVAATSSGLPHLWRAECLASKEGCACQYFWYRATELAAAFARLRALPLRC